jgi:hypothetical protein
MVLIYKQAIQACTTCYSPQYKQVLCTTVCHYTENHINKKLGYPLQIQFLLVPDTQMDIQKDWNMKRVLEPNLFVHHELAASDYEYVMIFPLYLHLLLHATANN